MLVIPAILEQDFEMIKTKIESAKNTGDSQK